MKETFEHIRNFCIIAHIDHGKSTLADRILDLCFAIPKQKMREQVLDRMDLERERGITIKAKSVRLRYHKPAGGQDMVFNLIDTPGHADFGYEVSRSLAACEGALLVIDASQGVEAQTLAHVRLALAQGLSIVPVINKIDLPSADPERVVQEMKTILGEDHPPAIQVSAKHGTGVMELMERIADTIPPPQGSRSESLKALIFDSIYDPYRGVLPFIRVFEGEINRKTTMMMFSSRKTFEVTEVGIFNPDMSLVETLGPGEVGYVAANIKNVRDSQVGDTITDAARPVPQPVPGYQKVKPVVFCCFYPVMSEGYEDLKEAMGKLQLNDASFLFEPDVSEALGFGFRCGFLGLLHMEIIQERIEREFGIEVLATAPHVIFNVLTRNGEMIEIKSPREFPAPGDIEEAEEPVVEMRIVSPADYVGGIMELCQNRRGTFLDLSYLDEKTVLITYELPLSEILLDFYNRLKSLTRGYGSMDYDLKGFRTSNLSKIDILVNREKVDGLSFIAAGEHAYRRARDVVVRLKEVIPRQLFAVNIQAAANGKIVAREDIPALRKDVLQKCYGGDITRKRKLLEKQRAGKRRMKEIGKIRLPQEAFFAILKTDS